MVFVDGLSKVCFFLVGFWVVIVVYAYLLRRVWLAEVKFSPSGTSRLVRQQMHFELNACIK